MRVRGQPGAVLLALALVAAFAGRNGAEAQGQSAGKLGGAWTVVSAEREGKPADELRGHTLTFTRETFVIHAADGKVLYRGTYTVDPARQPARIDFRHTEGELKDRTWLGIYALDGDRLTITDNAVDVTRRRPMRLATGPGSGHVLLVFERTRP
jgi:uncharacterized protein (TIGR03067 family)